MDIGIKRSRETDGLTKAVAYFLMPDDAWVEGHVHIADLQIDLYEALRAIAPFLPNVANLKVDASLGWNTVHPSIEYVLHEVEAPLGPQRVPMLVSDVDTIKSASEAALRELQAKNVIGSQDVDRRIREINEAIRRTKELGEMWPRGV